MLNSVRPCGCRGLAGTTSCRSGQLPASGRPQGLLSIRGAGGYRWGDTHPGSEDHWRGPARGARAAGPRLARARPAGSRRTGRAVRVLGGVRRLSDGPATCHLLHHRPPAGPLRPRRRRRAPLGPRRPGPGRHRPHHLRAPAADTWTIGFWTDGVHADELPTQAADRHLRCPGGRARPGRHRRRGPTSRGGRARAAPPPAVTRRRGHRLPAVARRGGGLRRLGDPAAVRPAGRALPRVVLRRRALRIPLTEAPPGWATAVVVALCLWAAVAALVRAVHARPLGLVSGAFVLVSGALGIARIVHYELYDRFTGLDVESQLQLASSFFFFFSAGAAVLLARCLAGAERAPDAGRAAAASGMLRGPVSGLRPSRAAASARHRPRPRRRTGEPVAGPWRRASQGIRRGAAPATA